MNNDGAVGALLVGAGNIGALYDIDAKAGKAPLTHLATLSKCPKIAWIDVVEINPENVHRLGDNRKVRRCFQSLEQIATDPSDYGAACVATPTGTHFTVLQKLNDLPVNIGHVFCEKPLFSVTREFHSQVSAVRQMKFPVTVNYPRTWSIDNTNLLNLASRLGMGAYTSGVASYGKGLKNNGSHMINLLLNLFGGPVEVTSIGKNSLDDVDHDPTISFGLLLNNQEITVATASSKSFSLFEVDLRFESGRIILTDGGRTLECYTPVPDPDYPGYRILGHHMTKPTDLGNSMERAIEDVITSAHSINLEQSILTADTYFKIEEEFNRVRKIETHV